VLQSKNTSFSKCLTDHINKLFERYETKFPCHLELTLWVIRKSKYLSHHRLRGYVSAVQRRSCSITKYLLLNQIKYPNTDINTVITIRYDVR